MANERESIGSIFERLSKAQSKANEGRQPEQVRAEAATAAEQSAQDLDALVSEFTAEAAEVPADEAGLQQAMETVSAPEDDAFSAILDSVLASSGDEDDAAVARKVQALYEEYQKTGVIPTETVTEQEPAAEEVPMEEVPAEETPAEDVPVHEEIPVEEISAPAEPALDESEAETPAEENPAEDVPVKEEIPVEEISAPAEPALDESEAETREEIVAAEESEAESPAEPVAAEEKPDDDAALLAALGYGDGSKAPSAGTAPRKNRFSELRNADLRHAFGYDGKPYQSRAQRGDILRKFDEDQRNLLIRACGTGFFALLLLVFDIFGKKFTGAWSAANYPIVNLMISLQLLLLCAVFSFREIAAGVRGIVEAKPVPASVTSAVVISTLLYNVILAISLRVTKSNVFTLYNSPAAVCLCIQALGDYLKLTFEKSNFERLSGMETMCLLQKEKGGAYTLRRTEFVGDFFRHTNLYRGEYQLLNFVMAPVMALGMILLIVALAAGRSFVGALNTFIVCIQMAMPVFAIVSMDIPFYLFQLTRRDKGVILLHESDTADYEKVEKIILDETDMFRGGSLRMTGLYPCVADYDYFADLAAVSAIGEKVGGTISQIFATLDAKEKGKSADSDASVSVTTVTEGGIAATVNGKQYLIGSRKFLNDCGIPCIPEPGAEFRPGSNVTFHISVDGVETLQVYLDYRMGPDFPEMLRALSENGNTVEIRCYDPNLDTAFVEGLLGDPALKVRVVRVENVEPIRAENEVNAGLIGESDDWLSIVRMADACGGYRKVAAFNRKVMAGVALVAALLAVVFCAIGTAVGMSPVYILLIYLASLIPSVVISRLV